MPKTIVSRARTRELLEQGPVLVKDLVAEFDCEYHLAWGLLRRMHIDRECHVGGWLIPPVGKAVPIYHRGPGDDAPRPVSLTNRERVRRHLARREWGITAAAIDKQLARRKALLQADYDLQLAEIARARTVIDARAAKYQDDFDHHVASLEAAAANAKNSLVRQSAPARRPLQVFPQEPAPAPRPVPPVGDPLSLLGQLQGAQR